MSKTNESPKNFPMTIHLTLTHECNINCAYCGNPAQDPGKTKEMSTEQWCDTIDKVTEVYGPVSMIVKGGEPMLRPDFFQIIEHIKSKGHHLSVVTNGTRIQDMDTAWHLEQYVDQMEISLDGVSPETTDQLKGDGIFDQIMEGIERVRQTRIQLGLSFVIQEENKDILWEPIESFLKDHEQTDVRIDNRLDAPLTDNDPDHTDFLDGLRRPEKKSCFWQVGGSKKLAELEIDVSGDLHHFSHLPGTGSKPVASA